MVSNDTGSTYGSDDQTRAMGDSSKAEQAKEAVDQVKEQAGQVTDQVKEQASKVTDKAKEQVNTRADEQKERAAQGIVGFADALHQVSNSMHDQNPAVANFAETAASKLEEFAGSLNNKDVNQIVSDVEDLARKQPALFIGGAFVAGVLAARFLKSSSDSSGNGIQRSRYGTSGGYDRYYGDYDTRGYSSQSQYSQQYGRPTGSSYSSGYGSTSRGSSYGTTGNTGNDFQTGTTRGTTTGMRTGTTSGQDTPGAYRTGSGDIDPATGEGIGTTGSTTSSQKSSRASTGTTGSTSNRERGSSGSSRKG